MTFKELNITEPILKAIGEKGYTVPTPIQEKAIPPALAKRDILGCAQTGTGKTASFAIPIIQHLQLDKEAARRQGIKALILTPTRELALQISECIDDYSKHTRIRHGVIFGGVNHARRLICCVKVLIFWSLLRDVCLTDESGTYTFGHYPIFCIG